MRPDLDRWLPDPAVRTYHRRSARVDPAALWAQARQLRIADTRALGPLVRWRIPGTPPTLAYHELFRAYPFTLLESGPRHSVSGLCGRIWTLARDYPRLAGADEFDDWREPGTVRVIFGHWVEGAATLCSEARVQPVDRAAALRLRALWTVIGRFETLVGAEPLSVAVQRARRA